MTKYVVWSAQLVNDEAREVIEVTRTDKRVAEDDAELIRTILHRRSWVQETT